MPGDGLTHGPPAIKIAGGSDHRFSRINRHSPRNGLRLIRDLPGVRALIAAVAYQSSSANLIPASGDQDHTTSPSASATFVRRDKSVHRLPAPRVVTIGRNVPLHRGGMCENIVVICPTPQATMYATDWHDGQFGRGVHAGIVRRGISASEADCSPRERSDTRDRWPRISLRSSGLRTLNYDEGALKTRIAELRRKL
jgi:hypothetical protein